MTSLRCILTAETACSLLLIGVVISIQTGNKLLQMTCKVNVDNAMWRPVQTNWVLTAPEHGERRRVISTGLGQEQEQGELSLTETCSGGEEWRDQREERAREGGEGCVSVSGCC